MGRFRSKRKRVYRPELLLQQLEERIVLDAAVNPAPQDNPTDHPANSPDHVDGIATTPAADAAAAGGAGGGDAGLVAQLPDSFNHVFSENLNVVLISNNLADVQTIADAAQHDAKVITYDAQHDNLASITAKLQDLVNSTGQKIHDLAIVGHGSDGLLNLGADQIQFFNLGGYKATFEALGQTLAQDAQIQFYGCSLAGDASGQAMVDSIATFTAATVFASTDTTGGNAHDWTLEYSSNSSVAMDSVLNTDALASDNTPLAAPAVLNAVATDGTSSPTNYVEMGGKIYFAADDAAHGKEIWVYDPATGSTSMLVDLNATGYSSINQTSITSNPLNLTVVGGNKLFFSATDNGIAPVAGQHGQELWMYDGTTVQLVKDINLTGTPAGTASGSPSNLVDVNGTLYFTATDGVNGVELWKSDGTSGGTVMVKDIYAGATSSNPANLTNLNGTLFFTATDAANGLELWKSDGTSAGTVLVANIMAGATGSSITSLTNVNNTLFFAANNGTTGLELWKSDGTGAGTVLVKDILAGTTGSSLANFKAIGNTLYFSATDGTTGVELWKSDGTLAGTVQVKDINAGTGASNPTGLTNVNGTLYFAAFDGSAAGLHGTELWKSDGSAAGTVLVKDIATGTGSSTPTSLTNINGTLYFAASDGTTAGLHGSELWKSDGTDAGTVMVTDIYSGTTGSGPASLTNVGGKLAFTANGWAGGYSDGATGNEPWFYDPTALPSPTPTLMKDIMLSHAGLNGGDPQAMMNVNGIFYWFQQVDSAHGMKLWRYDGTTTSAVTGISSATQAMTNVNGTLYLVANDGTHGNELMKVDANGNAVLVKDITVGSGSSNIGFNGSVDNLLFFGISGQSWQTNGTDAGTIQVTGPAGFQFGSGVANQFTNVNGTIYFQGYAGGWELYKTTGNGTVSLVTDINPAGGSNILNMTNLNGTLVFSALNSTSGQELWKVDALGNAVIVQDLNPGAGSSSPASFTNVNGTLFFSANNGTDGMELYKTDGTTITRVADINPTAGAGSNPFNLININGTLYFTATNGTDGVELWWTSDGTTVNQVNINTTAGTGSNPANLTNAGGTLVFSAADATTGLEPWAFDPINGLRSLGDIAPGTGGSLPMYFTYLDGTTYFRAQTSQTSPYNQELYQWTGTGQATLAGGAEIYPGPYANGNPINLMAVNNSLIFRAADVGGGSVYGDQIWKLDGPGTNHVPTASILPVANGLEDGGAINLGPAISVTDTDVGDILTVNLSLDRPAAGALSVSGGATYNAITGFWKVSGTEAQVNAALDAVTFTANPDWNGTVNITSHVEDAKGTAPANGQITLTIDPVNDAPTVATNTVNLNEDPAAPVAVLLSGTPGPADELGQILTYVLGDLSALHGKLYSDAAGTIELVATNTVTAAGPGQSPVTVYYVPDANYNGPASFSYSATDNGGIPVQGVTIPATVNINIAAVNDAPVNAVPVSVTVAEDVLTPITGITISDVDADPSSVQVTLGVTNGTLLVNDAVVGGLTALDIAGNGSGSVVLTGTLAQINATLADAAGLQYLSILNYNGPDTLTVLTSDLGATGSGGTLTDADPVAITVAPVADTPVNTVTTINVPANSSTTISLAGGLSVQDGDVNDTLFVDIKAGTGVTGLGWGTGTTFVPEYIFAGTEGYLNSLLNGLTAQVAAGFSGPATVLITTTDLSGLSDTDTLTITFAGPTSSAPVITTDVVGFTVNEDNGGLPVSLGTHVSVSDANGDPLTVDLTASAGWSGLDATASGGALVTGGGTAALHITGSMVDVQNTLATLTGTLITDFNGTATFGVTASDGINPPVTSPAVDIPIIPVNDAPVNTVPVSATADEDVLTPITGISISDVDAGASAVQVTLSVANGTLQVNDTVIGGLTAGGITSNGTGSVVLNGTLAAINATLADATGVQYLSVLNYNGSDTLTVLSDDLGATGTPGAQTDSDPVAITVNAVNDAPVNTVPVSATAVTDLLTPITGISISDVDAGASAVQVTLSVTNGTLQVSDTVVGGLTAAGITGNASGNVVLSGTLAEINATLADATGLQYLSGVGFVGPDTLTVLTSDLGATGSGGAQTDSDPVAITVNAAAINDPPVINLSAVVQQTDPTGAVVFNAVNGNLISVSDVDAGTGLVQVTLTATHGTMTLSGVTGLTFDPGQDGTADATMTFTGTLTDVNAALNGLSFNRDAGYTGLADVSIGVNDQGNTGTGGAQVANAVENISVEAYGVWFAGFGTETGWQVYNDGGTGDAYYTHDMTLYWWHVSSSDTWNFWNGTAWVATDALNNAPYADGYGPYGTWFHDTVIGGTYENYDVYIHTAATYISLDYTAVGATYWQETSAGAWSYWDGSAWYATGGFNVEPVNVWFHGYGADATWDVYNQSASGDEYFTHDQTVFWWHVVSGNTWQYWNGTAWNPVSGLGSIV